MKAFMTLVVFVASIGAHAAIRSQSNASCLERAGGTIHTNTNPPPKLQRKAGQPTSIQQASAKQRAQGS